MWIDLGVPECHILCLSHCDLDFDLSPLLFELGIPNMYGVQIHFWVAGCHNMFKCHCGLGLSLRNIVSRAYPIYYFEV